ncbi:MAG: rhomboid family intramembrane serine protease [Planctomycetaceae bacterium]|nr:rhomboid family intramembrane serine protease [Planctomycetaceae bacterium]
MRAHHVLQNDTDRKREVPWHPVDFHRWITREPLALLAASVDYSGTGEPCPLGHPESRELAKRAEMGDIRLNCRPVHPVSSRRPSLSVGGLALMLLFPINTDAPIYYRPVGTIALIALNVLVFLSADSTTFERYALHYGSGWTPLQWLTSNFLHGGFLHLLGNMLFLWGFGLIVEGKLGWQKFVPLYLTLGIAECALEQALFRHGEGMSFGASSAIFGLMAIALLWAPRNEVSILYWIIVRPGVMEISVLLFAGMLLVKSVIISGFTGISPSSEFLHLLGALFGLLLGWLLLSRNFVDCEGWDLFSVLRGDHQRASTTLAGAPLVERQPASRERRSRRPAASRDDASSAEERFFRLLKQGKPQAAWAELTRIRVKQPHWEPPADDLLALARGLRKKREWTSAMHAYRDYVRKSADPIARMEVAEILILILERPRAALKLLEDISPSTFNSQGRHKLQQLRERAGAMVADGIVELHDENWGN